MFEIFSIGSKCPIFHHIGNASGVQNLKIRVARGILFMEDNPWDWIILAKMQGAFCLCSLAPPELIASIQNVKAIRD